MASKGPVSMTSSDLPEPVRRLIVECIGSAAELEILLLLQRHPDRSWSTRDVDSELRIGEPVAVAGLRKLTDAGLLSAGEEGFRFAPRSRERERAVAELVDAYARRRVRVIEFLYNKPSDRITLFSDAFRFRRGKD